MDAPHLGSEGARPHRAREEATQVALEAVADGGPLAGVLEFLCAPWRTSRRRGDRLHPPARMKIATTFVTRGAQFYRGIRGHRRHAVSSMTGPCCYAARRGKRSWSPKSPPIRSGSNFRSLRSHWGSDHVGPHQYSPPSSRARDLRALLSRATRSESSRRADCGASHACCGDRDRAEPGGSGVAGPQRDARRARASRDARAAADMERLTGFAGDLQPGRQVSQRQDCMVCHARLVRSGFAGQIVRTAPGCGGWRKNACRT